MVINRVEVNIDLLDSLTAILEEDADGIPHDIKQLKKALTKNNDVENIRCWLSILRSDIETTIENLEQLCECVDGIKEEVDEADEEPKEYIAAFNRMFSLP